ncbi:polysaccharide deacetylase family protein, partial [Streptomyces indiaensis]|nr:polysaccharide deacetylase family protein [Streptomyces indiaensis]
MKKDQLLTRLLTRRRALLAGAGAVGAAATAGVVTAVTGDAPAPS